MPPTDGFGEFVKGFLFFAVVLFAMGFRRFGFAVCARARRTGAFVVPPPALRRSNREWPGNTQEDSAAKAEE